MSDLTPAAAAVVAAMEDAFPDLVSMPAAEGRARLAASPRPPSPVVEVGAVSDRTIPGPGGDIPVRVYEPAGVERPPVVVYFHGGGFVIGDLDTYDYGCRSLCAATDAAVVSVDYRLAPEHPFPAAPLDALAATGWVCERGDAWGLDATRVVVAGDSAGGTLATVVATEMKARVRGQLLIYPGTRIGADTESRERYCRKGYFLDAPLVAWFERNFLPNPQDAEHPWASPLLSTDLAGAPPAHVVIADCDPLRDEELAYVERLRDAEVDVVERRYAGMFHGFFNLGHVLPEAAEASSAAYASVRRWLA
jgi:acetyl esterase